jgi:Carboxypeptidase regulatory-like domain
VLATPRSRLAVIAAGLAGLALISVLVDAEPQRSGPELAAPGSHATVSVEASAKGPVAMGNGVWMGASLRNDRSAALRQLKAYPVRALPADQGKGEGGDNAAPQRAEPHARDTVVQSSPAAPAMPAAGLNFNGISFPGVACNCAPPDTNGEAGATQYVQIVNEGYQVFDKATGASVYGPVGITTIFSGFGGVCETAGDGDPIVLYDQLAGRWLVSQFAGASVPTDECIAISQTSDATGAYYRYDFHLGSNFFDYPHLAVWRDGYYMSDNVFNSSGTLYLGAQPFVFDRARMLAGQPATFQTTGVLGSFSDPILPADIDGSTPPPAGAPESFVRFPSLGAYQTYHYHADWVTPANSTFTTFASPAAASFTELCPTSRACVPEAGQSSSSYLDAIADRLMFRLTYRNFGDHESVVGNFTASSGGVAGIRWFELRNVTNGPETVFQESTYQPDSTWRWMGSAAMDGSGNIAIGFSASSSSITPQIRYAGRLAGDPLNTLGQGEATLFSGAGAQTGTSNRWGDYSDLTVDPVDDCTFWYTTEYYSTTASFNWRTRIGTFAMPGCGGPPPAPGAIAGHVTNADTQAPVGGATVAIQGGPSTSTDGSGAYSFANLDPGSYTVTASAAGYTTSAPANVTVTSGNTTTRDFALAPAPVVTTAGPFYAATSAAGSGGDGNGYETNRSNLWGAPNGALASDVKSGRSSSTSCTSSRRDKEIANYAVSGVGSTILGIQVQLTGRVSSTSSSPKYCVQLSWDGGASWTSGKTTGRLSTVLATYTLGSTSDTWGHAWTTAQLGSASFRVQIIDLASSTARTFYLDSVGVSVTAR